MAKTVLITGVSGFLGFRVLAIALEAGYHVKGVVRNLDQAKKISNAPSVRQNSKNLEFVEVPDLQTKDALDGALEGVTYIIHVASPLAQQSDDYDASVIRPALDGTLNVLRSAKKSPTVKRIVITSSVVALFSFEDFAVKETSKVMTDKSVAPLDLGPYTNAFQAYSASKVRALHASQDFIRDEKPGFDLINIYPGFILGKHELITRREDFLSGTNRNGMSMVFGQKMPQPTPASSVLLSDTARVHVLALDPKIEGGQGFITTGDSPEGYLWNDANETVKKYFPEAVKKGLFPADGDTPSKKVLIDATRTEKVFGIKFASHEEQIRELAAYYIELAA